MRQRTGRAFEAAGIADKNEQAFSDLGIFRIALCAEQQTGAEPAALQCDQHIVDDRHGLEQLAGLIGPRDAGARN